MWSERNVEYTGTERHFAVRWLKPGCPEGACVPVEEFTGQSAGFVKCDDELSAARVYNRILVDHPRWRLEVFKSQTTWKRIQANHDDSSGSRLQPVGQSNACTQGTHSVCKDDECACLCHIRVKIRQAG